MFNLSRYHTISLFFILMIGLLACESIDSKIGKAFRDGEFSEAEKLITHEIQAAEVDSAKIANLQYQLELMNRLRIEFSLTENDVRQKMSKYYPHITDSMLIAWEQSGDVEMCRIDGEKRYFNRAVSNFFRINKRAKAIKDSMDSKLFDGVESFRHRYLSSVFSDEKELVAGTFDEQVLTIDYAIVLKANAVPDGETVCCWMPFPRLNTERLKEIELLSVSEPNYVLAPEEILQRSIFMEKKTVKDSVTEFRVSYRIHTAAQWCNVKAENVLSYEKESNLYKEYTKENLPHIILSDSIKELARSIVGGETNPVEQVRLLYYWLNDNIPWAGALEYSVMECIPEYVLANRRGDCGMQTFLFLSMARSLGIPCKWQSGWYLLLEEKNLHDWAEVYYEGIGWVPVDVSFKLFDSADQRVREFYMNGLDSYRLIINDDIGQEFYPAKKFYRSEPYDFQRGELEWNGGNLYFDKWTYNMKVSVLD